MSETVFERACRAVLNVAPGEIPEAGAPAIVRAVLEAIREADEGMIARAVNAEVGADGPVCDFISDPDDIAAMGAYARSQSVRAQNWNGDVCQAAYRAMIDSILPPK